MRNISLQRDEQGHKRTADAAAVDAADGNGEANAADSERVPKRRRVLKETWFLFIVRSDDNSRGVCKCGCFDSSGILPLYYATPTSGHVKAHVENYHPSLATEFTACLNGSGNFNQLKEKIEKIYATVLSKTKKRQKLGTLQFQAQTMERSVENNLSLLAWAVANNVSRVAFDCPLWHSYLQRIGVPISPNRHALQDSYLPELSRLVVEHQRKQLSSVCSVSISCDGWRDRLRRTHLHFTIYTTCEVNEYWKIFVIHPDIINVPGRCTGEAIKYLVMNSIQPFVRFRLILLPS